MDPVKARTTITPLDRTHLPLAIEVLSKAFNQDPMVRYIFARSTATFTLSLIEMFRFSCEVRLLLNWPLLGCRDPRHRLVGVAGLSPPEEVVWPDSLQAVYKEFKTCIGGHATELMESYTRLADTNRPIEPHHHLGMIGVDPQEQGHGYGLALLKIVHKMSEEHPTSTGIWLDTENSNNVPWYERFGYQVRAETQLGDVQIWGMFRPNQDRSLKR